MTAQQVIDHMRRNRDELKRKPTLKHRPILTFGILGTVYGISPEGEVRYFDYDWDVALEFAGVTDTSLDELDFRLGAPGRDINLPEYSMWHPERQIGAKQKAWWVK